MYYYVYHVLEHVQKKFVVNRKKIKGGCQSGRKVVIHNSKNDLPLVFKYSTVLYDPENSKTV